MFDPYSPWDSMTLLVVGANAALFALCCSWILDTPFWKALVCTTVGLVLGIGLREALPVW